MRLVKIILSIIISGVLFLAACAPGGVTTVEVTKTDGQLQDVQGKLENTQREVAELNQKMAALQSQYDKELADAKTKLAGSQAELTEKQKQNGELSQKITTLQNSYDNIIKQAPGLRNPAWAELLDFLKQDKTDALTYNLESFDCNGFAIVLRDHAQKLGIRTAYVEIEFAGTEGHALNAFETTDKGLVYIDNTEGDKVAYVQTGQLYGTITLDAVKSEYISCSGDPAEFWRPLNRATAANPSGYSYYTDYEQRQEFYHKSIDAYNQAAADYNRGSSKISHTQLNTWQDNLKALQQDLGNIIYEPLGAVKNVQTYWGTEGS